jgi:hypothetical protein
MNTLHNNYAHGAWVWYPGEIYSTNAVTAKKAVDALVNYATNPFGQNNEPYDMLLITARFETFARGKNKYNSLPTLLKSVADPLTDSVNAAKLRATLNTLHENGVEKIEYLYGESYSIFDKTALTAPLGPIETVKSIIAFNKGSANAAERFDGVHLDTEPHTMNSGPYAGVWYTNRLPCGYNKDVTANWQWLLTQSKTLIQEYNTGWCATTPGCVPMTLADDIGTDLAFYNKPMWDFFNTPIASLGVYPVDYHGIMNYFDTFDVKSTEGSYLHGFTNDPKAGGMVQNLNATSLTMCSGTYDKTGSTWKVPVKMGSETGPTSIAPADASFWDEGFYELRKTQARALQNYEQGNYKGVLSGFLDHHYGSLTLISANAKVSCKVSADTPAIGSYSATVSSTDNLPLCVSLVNSDTKASIKTLTVSAGETVSHVVTSIPAVLNADVQMTYNPATGSCIVTNSTVIEPTPQAPNEIYISFNQAASSCAVSSPTAEIAAPNANEIYFVYNQAANSCAVSQTPAPETPAQPLIAPPLTAEIYFASDPQSGECDYHFYSVPCTA